MCIRVPDAVQRRLAVHRRAGTVTDAALCYDPGSAAHHAVKSGALRSIPGNDAPYSAWPSMIGPNSCHFSPVNFIICTCSIG
jgi:hypothetical protein